MVIQQRFAERDSLRMVFSVTAITIIMLWPSAVFATLLEDEFDGTSGAFLNGTKWTFHLDPDGGTIYQTGTGWAKMDPDTEHTGSSFTTLDSLPNSGSYSIRARVLFTGGWAAGGQEHWANHVFILLRNPSNTYGWNPTYENYEGPQVRFDIHTHWHEDPYGIESVSIREKNTAGWQAPAWADRIEPWPDQANVVNLYIDYNADNRHADFRIVESGIQLTQAGLDISAKTLQDIGPDFKVDFGMEGYSPEPVYWDWVVITPEPATLTLLALGGAVLAARRRKG